MRDLRRPTAVAAVLLTPFLVLGACKSGDPAPKSVPEPEPDETPAAAGFTHDGAVPIAVITSFEDTRRSILDKKPDVTAAVACSFLTADAQESTVEAARGDASVGKKADCPEAMRALAERGVTLAKVETFTVLRAEDEVTEIVVVDADGSARAYTLTGEVDDDQWLIDEIAVTEPPKPEPVPEAPVGELSPEMKKDRKQDQK